ncbi:class C sortase [Mobiluncus curtisii]|uniref:Class C sortase n=1 Tax=Mobiluncus curtisii TaxID=2051 RepID=A0A7Y0YBT3_9ACTO|nr:class C sortase [Mobiluncus curtisii]MCU9987180.1 class C sortase [Mobiluncus curtisii]MCV0001083.1 class C sortase [Mobiluncus curtisii]NMW49701.1 class C sortase [Mobiluncus curtisii]NMW86367.1 class C sortase [Mobiluncus curtisii]NMW88142.1 class C sortase [Mobiluncus curtisii]
MLPVSRHYTSKKSNRQISRLVPLLFALAGIALFMYPVVATQWNNYRQNQITTYYARQVQEPQRLEALEASVAAARRYNEETPGAPILDPWLSRVSQTNNPYQEYLEQLNVMEQMGQLIIPKIRVNLPIYHGTEPKTLERGIGHLYGSSLPVGGAGTHAVLTGHTGLTNATLLDHLEQMRVGDAFYLNVAGLHMKYRVVSVVVVEPTEIGTLKRQDGRDLVTLITCTPYGINSHRLLVTGERTALDKNEENAFNSGFMLTWSWWMVAALVASTLMALLTLWWWRGKGRRRKEKHPRKQGIKHAKAR